MKYLRNLIIGAVAAFACADTAYSDLNVVCALPDLAAIAKEIGGDKVEIATLAKPTEDSHYVDPRPSFVVKLNNADALIEGGADLESGWLPPLVQGSRNSKIQAGGAGRIVASQGIQLMGVPDVVSRAQGDIHARGNPHFLVDPIRAKTVARHIADAFVELDPENSDVYQTNLKKLQSEIDSKMKGWEEALAPYRGRSVAAYHDSWVYFGSRFGLDIDVFLEPKPGIPPSPAHLAKVIDQIKARRIKAILVEPYQDRRTAESVASKTGAQVVDFAQYPGALEHTDTYVQLIDALVSRLARALGGKS